MASRILYIYDEMSAHDVAMRQELEGWLYTLHRERHHTTQWQTILPGDDLRAERERHLKDADIILLLVSVDFVRSDPCYALACEALEQRRRGARVVPILLRPVASWETLPFGGIQPLPRDGRPVSRWDPRDDAWHHISAEIRALLAELDQHQPASTPRMDDALQSGDESGDDLSYPGECIGNYRISRMLGQGGFSRVYEAVHEMTRRRVAIKTWWSGNKRAEQVKWEALATGLASHPGVVDIYDVGTVPSGPGYIVMELLVGASLNALVEEPGGASVAEALLLIWQVATTMEALHARGIVHCDLKPYNIMVCEDPLSSFGKRAKVFDFGLALLPSEESLLDPFTEENKAFVGTQSYMSPEQMSLDRRELTTKTDVYTLGTTLFELLTGRLPFSGGMLEVLMLRTRGAPPPLDWMNSSVPTPVIDLVRRMLEHAPDARPSMTEVAACLAVACTRR